MILAQGARGPGLNSQNSPMLPCVPVSQPATRRSICSNKVGSAAPGARLSAGRALRLVVAGSSPTVGAAAVEA